MKSYLYLTLAVARLNAPGFFVAGVVAAAATFISEHQGGSSLLYALLLGMALKSVVDQENSGPGIGFSARSVLRIGVALLGLRISVEQITALGLTSAAVIVLGVLATIAFGIVMARWLGFERPFGVLTGCATGICGASAALAVASLLPRRENSERDASFAVVAVTTLATVAMIFFPPALRALGFSDHDAGFIIGGTIHDVAQVVGAGYMISPDAGDTATVTKLFRVALLIPITLMIASFCEAPDGRRRNGVNVPWFLVLFIVFVLVRSYAGLPGSVVDGATALSRWCFVIAIAAVGLKTTLGDFKQIGWPALMLVVAETAVITLIIGTAAYLT